MPEGATAAIEELFSPSDVVAIGEADGSVRLMMYCGPIGDGSYVSLKHAVIRPEHASGLFREAEAGPELGLEGADDGGHPGP